MVGSHTALQQSGMPSDLFVFPDEDHIKSQPAHRLAVYRRNLDWFGFWLKDEIPSDTTRRTEVERWQEMRKYWLGHAGGINARAGSKEGQRTRAIHAWIPTNARHQGKRMHGAGATDP